MTLYTTSKLEIVYPVIVDTFVVISRVKLDDTLARDSNVNSILIFCKRKRGISFSEFPINEYNGALNEKVSPPIAQRRPSNNSVVKGVVVVSAYPKLYCCPY